MAKVAEIYRLVAKRSGSPEAAELAELLSVIALEHSSELAEALRVWIITRGSKTYRQAVEEHPSTGSLAPIFFEGDGIDDQTFAKALLGLGRTLMSEFTPLEKHFLDDLAEQFVNSVDSNLSLEETVTFKEFLRVAISGIASYSDLKNNHWFFFILPVTAVSSFFSKTEKDFTAKAVGIMREKE